MKLIVSLILIFMSVVHIIFGEKQFVRELKRLKADPSLIGAFRVMSVQGGLILFAVGVAEIMVYSNIINLTGVSIYFPLGIICLNVLACFIVGVVKHRELMRATIPQFVIFLFIIVLQILSLNQ